MAGEAPGFSCRRRGVDKLAVRDPAKAVLAVQTTLRSIGRESSTGCAPSPLLMSRRATISLRHAELAEVAWVISPNATS
jgi:hypothetical protein